MASQFSEEEVGSFFGSGSFGGASRRQCGGSEHCSGGSGDEGLARPDGQRCGLSFRAGDRSVDPGLCFRKWMEIVGFSHMFVLWLVWLGSSSSSFLPSLRWMQKRRKSTNLVLSFQMARWMAWWRMLRSLGPRVVALEGMIHQLSQDMTFLVQNMKPSKKVEVGKKPKAKASYVAPTAKSSSAPSDLTKQRKTLGFAARYPSLDASVVSAALAAGVEPDHLEEMEKLMGSSLHGAKRLREPALKKAQVTSSVPELSESEEEEQEEESGGAGADAAPSVQTSLDRLTEIVSLLTAEQAKKMKASKVDQALDGVSAGTSLEAPSGGSSKRAAAARRILRQALLDHPEDISALVEKLMLEDLTHRVQAPGLPSATLNARAWVEHRSRLGPHKTAAYCCWSAAGILDDLISWKASSCKSKGCAVDPTIGSNGHRSWLLGLLFRAFFGAKPTICISCRSLLTFSWRRRESFLPSPRWEMGRNLPLASSRHRGFPDEAALSGKEDGGGGEGQRQREGKSKGKSQGKGRSRQARECMTPKADSGSQEPDVKVPGLRAPTVHVPALVNSIARLIGKHGGRLATFFKSFFTARPYSERQSSHSGCLWPMPLPYPEAFRCGESFFFKLEEEADLSSGAFAGLALLGKTWCLPC